MAATLPPPEVPALGADNTIDLDQLGTDDLITYINHPTLKEGDFLWPTWYGCASNGDPRDMFTTLIEVGPGELEPEGKQVSIGNNMLQALDQGYVFYSFKLHDPSQPDERGEESKRRFFYVGKRPFAQALPVPHFRQSHELHVDLNWFPTGPATVVALPYKAMSVGDRVILEADLHFDDGMYWETFRSTNTLVEADIGQPQKWLIDRGRLQSIADGFAHLRYVIEYADPTTPTTSASQTVQIIAPPSTLLPAPGIKNFNGSDLDPDVFPDGIFVVVEPWPGMQPGDSVVLYADGDSAAIASLLIDSSTVDSGIVELHLGHVWLAANVGLEVSLHYQHARVGTAGTSQPLKVTLSKPIKLPWPNVEKATAEGEGRGRVYAEDVLGGVYVKLPADAEISPGMTVQMHWEGRGSTGSVIVDHTAGDKDRFQIPASALPANLEQWVNVFYKVTPPGKNSDVFELLVKDFPTAKWPTLQIEEPKSPNNVISLAKVTTGVLFRLDSWTFMDKGQRVRITVDGKSSSDDKETFDLRVGDAEVVTEEEYFAGQLFAELPLAFLQKLKLNEHFSVEVFTSFDDGVIYKQFPFINPQLVA
ncbi:hypothetical protein [Pseudomonas sp. S2_E01]